MKRILSPLAAALTFVALVLALSLAGPARPAEASSDIHQRCTECLARNQERYDRCLAQFEGEAGQRCHDQFNMGISICHREFCEQ